MVLAAPPMALALALALPPLVAGVVEPPLAVLIGVSPDATANGSYVAAPLYQQSSASSCNALVDDRAAFNTADSGIWLPVSTRLMGIFSAGACCCLCVVLWRGVAVARSLFVRRRRRLAVACCSLFGSAVALCESERRPARGGLPALHCRWSVRASLCVNGRRACRSG